MTPSRDDDRPVWAALQKGISRRCPRCGAAPLFAGYLSVRDTCGSCGLEFHHHRADDMHPWVTIMIVGHLVVPLMVLAFKADLWPDWVHMTLWPALVVILSLAILPFAKGGVIALQWAMKMHGFARPS